MDAGVSSKANPSGTFESDVRAIVAAKYVRTAGPGDAVAGMQPSFVVEPGSEQELAKVLMLASAAGLAVIPRGGGTKLEWGNAPARADVILSTARMNRVIEHAWADLTVSVEAGCTIAKLQETLAKHGQRLALDALWPERATVGGVLSTNDSGALRLRFGSLRDLVIGVTVALADGTVASSGGKVVKNVAGYDLPKLVTGAFGTLGVITRAIFRLHPLPGGDCRNRGNDSENDCSRCAMECGCAGDGDWMGAAGRWGCGIDSWAREDARMARGSRRISGDRAPSG